MATTTSLKSSSPCGPAGRVIETLGADMEINGIKFKQGRKIVYCHDLARIADNLNRRTLSSSRRDGRSRRGWCG